MYPYSLPAMAREIAAMPPAFLKVKKIEKRKRKTIYLLKSYTHTYIPGRNRVNPERQEEGKSGYRRRAKGQNGAGKGRGRKGTNGPPKPTYPAKRDLTKTEYIPKPHDTLRRSTRKELGTEWGLVSNGYKTTKN